MIHLTKRLSFVTLVIFSVAAIADFAQSQTCAECAASDVGSQIVEAGSEYAQSGVEYAEVGAQYTEIGETGAYFEQAAPCGCQQQSGCGCGGRSGKLRSIARALRPFGDPGCYESYRSVFGGWSELEDEGGTAFIDGLDFNDGFIVGTAKGIYLNDKTRIERETSWRNNSAETLTATGGTFPLDGRMNNFSRMVNVVRDFRTDSRVQPYAGLGLGASRQDGEFTVNGVDLEVDDWAFAYQGFAGLRFVKSSRVSLFAEYRYFGNSETDLELNFRGGGQADLSDFEYTSENILFGIQFKR